MQAVRFATSPRSMNTLLKLSFRAQLMHSLLSPNPVPDRPPSCPC